MAKAEATRGKKHYIVAIGASAGGLEAIHEFFDHMPQHDAFSFVIIQHLSSDYKSLLVELIAKHTHMRVFEAENGMTVQRECVYVIPNNKLIVIHDGRIILSEKKDKKGPNTAINRFFSSLAKDAGSRAIAMILSGTGTDGTIGAEMIKKQGGLVIVQEPATSKFDGMPLSAINAGVADLILSPEMIPNEIFNYVKEAPGHILNGGKVDEALLNMLFKLIYDHSGYDFQYYKTPTIIRRISRRITQKGFKSLEELIESIQQSPNDAQEMGEDFLINVTQFFRDPAAFKVLEESVFPDILAQKQKDEYIKIWVTACSTGEEAYSIAILLNEFLEKKRSRITFKIFATDLDPANIDAAAKNMFPLAIDKNISQDLLNKYFIRNGKTYSAIPGIRKNIVFAVHDIAKNPPFIKNDLVTCRNMLIYMNSILQQKILSTFHFSLNKGGFLFLGPSETASHLKTAFQEIDGKWKIYKKTGNFKYENRELISAPATLQRPIIPPRVSPSSHVVSSITSEFNQTILEDFGFVSFFIDSNYEIKESLGDFGRFLSLPQQKLNLNILKMVPPELSVALNTAIRKVWKERQKVYLKSVRVKNLDKDNFISVVVKPVNPDTQLTLVVLGENKQPSFETSLEEGDYAVGADQTQYVQELESELNETRSNLQLAVESLETTNEELQSSNEELLSSNEELQSSNEELQSLNEELHTLNTEHQLKIRELINLNDDLNNYFKSTYIGQIFLDSDLQIRKFNPAAVKMVNLIESDIGRPISHISNNIKSEDFTEDIKNVQQTGKEIEREINLPDGKASIMRIMPYVRQDKSIDGLVVTFVDVSQIKQLNNIVNSVFNASVSGVLVLESIRNHENKIVDFRLVTSNEASKEFLPDNDNIKLKNDVSELTVNGLFEHYVKVVEKNEPYQGEISLGSVGKWFELVAVKMLDGFVATLTDVTQRRVAEQRLRKNYNELISARESLKVLNQDLETRVTDRTQELVKSQERFIMVSQATNEVIWDRDLTNNTTWWSQRFNSIFGYEDTDQIKTFAFWRSKIHPDDRPKVLENLNATINNGQNKWEQEFRFQTASGNYLVILDRALISHDEFGTPFRMIGSMLDISKLKETEMKLHTSELQFRRVFESNLIGMAFTKVNGQIVECNDVLLNMLGYTRQELEDGSLNWENITPKEFIPASEHAVMLLETTGVCPPFEKQYFRKDGSRIDVMLGATVLNEESKANVTYIIDITEQKQMQRKEASLQKRFQYLANSISQKIWTATETGFVDYYNDTFLKYTGLNLDKLLGDSWVTIIHSDDLQKTLDSWENAVQTGTNYEVEHRLLAADGKYRWHITRAILQKDETTMVSMWVGTSTDFHDQKIITEALKITGESFRQLADQTPFMIWKIDENQCLTYVNKPWIDFTGISFEDSLGSAFWASYHQDDRGIETEKFKRAFEQHIVYRSKFRLRRKDGIYRWVLAQSNPVFDPNFQGYIGSFTDITEQEMAQQATKLLMRKKDEFMSIASHELKTPITSMKASLQIVERLTKKNGDLRQVNHFIEKANSQVDKLTGLIEDLLDVTKIQAGKMKLNLSDFKLKPVIMDCLDQVKVTAEHYEFSIEGDADADITADKHRLEQVIINFLSNAVKYSPDSKKIILNIKPENNYLKIAVTDFGIGIPTDKLPYIFDRFFRVQESSQKFSGLGLGLYICAEIVERHGGKIGVESNEGKGSTFWFTIPIGDNAITQAIQIQSFGRNELEN
ncbi:PAS domain S-box protein [Pedobacter sp. HMF7647]|uniref:PAS domain S-box protein n=1 Tax=Hufsiella arboris TaxID=2695275 RepID=A0A7K1Y9T9_9SPHI|nr:PAS domain S-box protein [Hufsiella arboris]MXV51101.1 PAS domain S-box protein [Hufsiella arboris]